MVGTVDFLSGVARKCCLLQQEVASLKNYGGLLRIKETAWTYRMVSLRMTNYATTQTPVGLKMTFRYPANCGLSISYHQVTFFQDLL